MFRKSIRKKGYDYSSAGYYFLTICTHFKQHTLAKIDETGSNLTSFGQIVQYCWDDIPKHFRNVRLDAFKIMPNHIHGIIQLTESGTVELFSVIQNFKSVSTRKINNRRKLRSTVWQQNYFERIIRTEKELNLIRLYISLNPILWHKHAELAELHLTDEKIWEILEKYGPSL
ncbi:transposase [bacterium]|nr:transposase [bacterium]MCI0605930.1 transposase [bacterium]